MMNGIAINRIMSKAVQHVALDCPLEDVVEIMVSKKVSCVMVTLRDRPVGVISERDIVRILRNSFAGKSPTSLLACDVMSTPVESVQITATVHETLCLIEKRNIRRLAVVESNGTLAGVLNQSDLLRGQAWDLEIERQSHWALLRDLREGNG